MPFCASCGSQAEGRFCPKCGSPIAASPGASPLPPPVPNAQAGLTENVACALCYLLLVLTGVLFLVLAPYNQNRNIRFHAFQSIFVWGAGVVAGIALTIVNIMLSAIPFLGALISVVLYFALVLGGLILWLMLMYKAYNKERWVLPVIGPLAEKQA